MKQQISTQFLRAATSSGVWLAESCMEGWYINGWWVKDMYQGVTNVQDFTNQLMNHGYGLTVNYQKQWIH